MDFTKNFSLEGKIAWVTGASYGIGFAIATAFAQSGAVIVFNDLNQEKVEKGLASYREEGIEAHGYVCDVTSEEDVKATVERITREVGVIDILVNNAGIIKRIPMLEMSAEQFRQVISTSMTWRNCSALISSIGMRLMIPALLTRISITPTSASIFWSIMQVSSSAFRCWR